MKKTYQFTYRFALFALLTVFAISSPVRITAQTPCFPPGQSVSPNAGTLTPKVSFNCTGLANILLEAAPDGNAVLPNGYQTIYILTSGPNYVIRQTGPVASFSVSGNNAYHIHGLVYDPATFDVTTLVPHVTTLAAVNATLVQGGGTICASLDMTGAAFTVNRPVLGALTAVSSTVCAPTGTATVEAIPDGNANVPYPYTLVYVLTSGNGLVIEQLGQTPSFSVTGGGLYTIHTLIYNQATLDLSTIIFGVTTANDINAQLIQGGGNICAVLDMTGAAITVEDPAVGAISANDTYCSLNISATVDVAPVVPANYQVAYVLTQGAGLVILQTNTLPSFTAPTSGFYTIHTLVYDPATLDLSSITPGVTTGFDVNGLLVQGGGSICGALDVTGASFNLDVPEAAELSSNNSSNCSGLQLVNLAATVNTPAHLPAGYQEIYVLTSGNNYTIRQVGPAPSFNVSGNNTYRIHSLVYDPATLDLSTIVLHQTSALSINALLVQGGGSICASLDLVGAQFNVRRPIAGTLTADNAMICFDGTSATVSATANGNSNVPVPFQRIYVLTSGAGLVIEQTSATPSFTVTTANLYTIHTLVYDPATLDLSTVVPGVTTAADINSQLVQGGGSICASLDLTGAATNVANPDAGGITTNDPVVCLIFGFANVAATPDGDAVVPFGYQTRYLLTTGIAGTIQQIGANPSFIVNANGIYRIQTLVYDPSTFSLASITIGSTNVINLFTQFEQGGGSICANVDLLGAPTIVAPFPLCNFLTPRYTAEGDFDAQTYELVKTIAESGYNGGAVSILNAYPNPVSDKLNIEVLSVGDENVSVTIYNMMGQEVKHTVISTVEGVSTHTVDVSALENGNYMIRVQSGNDSVSKTFMVRN